MTKQFHIAIIDYDMGNVKSIENAISHIGNFSTKVTADAATIAAADCIILPGVGAFPDAMQKLRDKNLIQILNKAVLIDKKPILGICLGMQLLFDHSTEIKLSAGLGWIPGSIELMKPPSGLRVPHVGWNDIKSPISNPFFDDLSTIRDFFFVHSFHAICDDSYKIATVDYGFNMTAAVQKDNIVGMQFHPEKSQHIGLAVLKHFFDWAQTYHCEQRLYA